MSTESVVVTLQGTRVDTKLTAQARDQVSIDCVGYVDQGERWLHRIVVDGDGRTPSGDFEDDGLADAHYPLPGGVRYSLLAQIGSSSPFAVGKRAEFLAPAAGPISLLANDDNPQDNSLTGSGLQTPWRVSVDVKRPDPPPPPATPGLRIEEIEIIQVTSSPRDALRIEQKRTLVRAYLTVRDRAQMPANAVISGHVFVRPTERGNLHDTGWRLFALNPTGTPDAVVVRDEGSPMNKDRTDGSLNFEIGGDILRIHAEMSHYTFEVVVGINGRMDDSGFSARDQKSAGFWSAGRDLSCSYVLVEAMVNGTMKLPSLNNLFALHRRAMLMLPVRDSGSRLDAAVPTVVSMSFELTNTGEHGGLDKILSHLTTLHINASISLARPDDVLLAWVPEHGSSPHGLENVAGGLLSPELVIAIATDDGTEGTIAHELCHGCGIRHANRGNVKDADPTLPTSLDGQGWDPDLRKVVRSGTAPLMGYDHPRWTTLVEYQRVHQCLTRGSK